jgi:hypothetical protein
LSGSARGQPLAATGGDPIAKLILGFLSMASGCALSFSGRSTKRLAARNRRC